MLTVRKAETTEFDVIMGIYRIAQDFMISTGKDNKVMQNVLAKHGFLRCGIIYLKNGDPRIAYQWSGKRG